jgi:predicted transcriptional regulator
MYSGHIGRLPLSAPSFWDSHLKVTMEVVERIKRLRRLGRRAADIAQLSGLSEPTVRKVLKEATTKEPATETQETGTEIVRED